MKNKQAPKASSGPSLAALTGRTPPAAFAGPAPSPGTSQSPLARLPRPKKSWGQHFLRDRAVLAAIIARGAAAAPLAGRCVLELGAGLGALTEPLLKAGAQVVAVERDRDLVPHLEALATRHPGRLEVLAADVQSLDYAALARRLGGPLHVFGNLPYQLSSRILVALADAGAAVGRAELLVQKEVGERLVAGPPGRTYGLLSVLVQRRFDCSLGRLVFPGAFVPPPKVHSVLVHLVAKDALAWRGPSAAARDALAAGVPAAATSEERWLVAAARAAFSARRKTLRNSLMHTLDRTSDDICRAIATAGLAATARAETLTLTELAALGRALFGAATP